jgi:hypothetical protein
MEKLLLLYTEILKLFCTHSWVFEKKELIGCEFYAKNNCRFCKKIKYLPFSAGEKQNNYDHS